MEWLAPLGDSFVARALIRSPTLYIFANASHILSLGMLLGASVILDLRLLGAFARLPLNDTAIVLSRVAAVALACAVVTGALLFSVRPVEYAGNTAFLIKILLVLFATANALAVKRSRGWHTMTQGAPVTAPLRFSALASLFLWLGALLAGRWIGFL
ncbi:DUF2214 domain-containing protein [Rhizobium rhizophilum]|uniref:DUF2214 domain-containing protein n=1 Tax=Rhizobium rhizophilum TaxID=1850373 RepID=A0ABY2QUZ3_9HYPH|nr:DUF6644 family protein [Rhizobium rhizophilum]THV14355.1 DUF2214 domain-containing protein [Rhizobium rhizophilum]